MIHEVLPMMVNLIFRLEQIKVGLDLDGKPLHTVTRVAAKAALVLARKYMLLMKECEAYEISIGESHSSIYFPSVLIPL